MRFFFASLSILLASGYVQAAPLPGDRMPSYAWNEPSSHNPYYPSPEQPSHASQQHYPTPSVEGGNSGEGMGKKRLLMSSTDGKFDDKMAMSYNERYGHYPDHLIMYHGLADPEAASGDNKDWFRHMDENRSGFHKAKRTYFHGSTPFKESDGSDKAASHERLFDTYKKHRNAKPTLHSLDRLPDYLQRHNGKDADFFSMAPIPADELQAILQTASDRGVNIANFHHISGYNSRQDSESRSIPSPATNYFVQNLHRLVHQNHPHANVIFTQSKHNFGEKGAGGTQDYGTLPGRFPHHHIKQVGETDGFALNQIQTAEKMIREKGERPHVIVGSDGVSPITAEEVWQARRNQGAEHPDTFNPVTERLRQNILNGIAENQNRHLSPQSHIYSRLNSVVAGIKNPCQGETCDANHVALVHHALENDSFDPIHFEDRLRMRKAEQGEVVHGFSPQYHPRNKDEVVGRHNHYFPHVFHNPEQDEASSSGHH